MVQMVIYLWIYLLRVSLYGESGSGKTTLLRIIAGLEKCDAIIIANGKIWQDKDLFVPTQRRNIGFVFQDYALFPNMSVKENLLYVNDDEEFLDQLLQTVHLTKLKNSMPHSLSGGQKQRVALCRALMQKPELLLLDEPFSALDNKIKNTLYDDLKLFHKRFNLTTILVTHNKTEVYKLCDYLFYIHNGKIIDQNKPYKFFLDENSSNITAQVVDKIGFNKIVVVVFDKLFTLKVESKRYNNIKIDDKIKLIYQNNENILE
jgi:molybdate transport system ATP-binding protein